MDPSSCDNTRTHTELGPLVQRAQAGDTAAAEALVEALYPLVWRIVRARRPVRMAEEDLAQEVFRKVFQHLADWRQGSVSIEHWVARIASRTCLDALRAERRRPELRQADLSVQELEWLEYMQSSSTSTPPTTSTGTAASELIQKLLAMLPTSDRTVLEMLDLEERSTSEIASLLGWSRPLVKVRAFRARLRLRKLVKELNLEMPDEIH